VGQHPTQDGTFSRWFTKARSNASRPPLPAQIAAGTREVRAANLPVLEPAGGVANLPSLAFNTCS